MKNLPFSKNILTVASGKGGVGKTSATLNLATLLTQAGKKVLVLDGDTGLANADVQLNLQPAHDLADVLAGTIAMAQAVTPTTPGFGLIAGRAGHRGLTNLTGPQLDGLFAQLLTVAEDYDVTLIDAAAGVSPLTLSLCARAKNTLLVATPDPASFIDAYALIKLLWQVHGTSNALLVANQADATEGRYIHQKLTVVMEKSLQLPALPHIATIPQDKIYAQSIRQHQLAALSQPACAAINALRDLARELILARLV